MLVHQYTSAENRLEDIAELCRGYLTSLTSRAIKKAITRLLKLGLLVRYKDSLESGRDSNHQYLQINYDLLEEMMLPSKVIDESEDTNSY